MSSEPFYIKSSNRASYRKITKWIKENPQFSTNVFNEITVNVVNHRCAQVAVNSAFIKMVLIFNLTKHWFLYSYRSRTPH